MDAGWEDGMMSGHFSGTKSRSSLWGTTSDASLGFRAGLKQQGATQCAVTHMDMKLWVLCVCVNTQLSSPALARNAPAAARGPPLQAPGHGL